MFAGVHAEFRPCSCTTGASCPSFGRARHSKGAEIEHCRNPEIKAELIEGRVFAMVRDVMLDPAKLRACMEHFREDTRVAELRLEREVKAVDGRLQAVHEQKRRVIDIYASGDLSRDGYVQKNRELDGMVETLIKRAHMFQIGGDMHIGIVPDCLDPTRS